MAKPAQLCIRRPKKISHARPPLLIVVFVCVGGPALAIPSPELVIGSISSLSQLFALAAATLRGGAVVVGARARKNQRHNGKSNRRTLIAALIMGILAIALLGLNILQYSSGKSGQLARLQATLIRPAQTSGTRILDPNLKETSFLVQQSSTLSMSTATAAKLLTARQAGQNGVLFLDIREDAEHQIGSIPGAEHVRFPDLPVSKIDLSGQPVVLFCYNGNRSAETCASLVASGIDCKFIAGGIEKWIVESRPFTDETVRSLADMRAIPMYRNDQTLLDTDDVKQLIKNDDIQFVDTRYPADFAAGHLPGAINIPLRALPSSDINARIIALADRPVVAACYDRRSCFMGQVLGLELSKAGFDFRGRYTVPWEYYIPKPLKPHIAAWLADQEIGLWQKTVAALAGLILAVGQKTHILLAIFALALVSRLLILPISLKAERDQITTKRVETELAALKSQLADDPKRLVRAITAFYSDHGLTPLRNLLALAFLPLMMLGLSSVQMAAGQMSAGFFWVPELGLADPIFLLPALFAFLGGVYLHVAVAKSRRQRLWYWIIGASLLFVPAFLLSAAGNLYLISSLILLLCQRAYVVGVFGLLIHRLRFLFGRWWVKNHLDGLIPLTYPRQLQGCGNKAYRLAVLKSDGVAVPDGVVLTTAIIKKFQSLDDPHKARLLGQIWRLVGADAVAVRSSANSEDGEDKSFAGVYDSFLGVTKSGLETAIDQVAQSFSASRVNSYDSSRHPPDDGNILVQAMVQADFAGVLFTQDPEAPGLAIVEMVRGTADDLVSGKVNPVTLRFGRHSHARQSDQTSDIDMAPLLAIGKRAEALFGAPQDIEWTYRQGRFEIVQSRDITTLCSRFELRHSPQVEWQRIMNLVPVLPANQRALERDEMSEVLPRPTPLSLSYMQAIWASGGSVDLACRRLGLAYAPGERSTSHLVTLFGRLYSDVPAKTANSVTLNRSLIRQLDSNPGAIEDGFYNDFLPGFHKDISVLRAMDFENLPLDILQSKLIEQYGRFIGDTHVEVEVINIATSYYTTKASQAFEAAGIDGMSNFAEAGLAGPAAAFHNAAQLPQIQQIDYLLGEVGHRAVFDYELNDPRYSEIPELLGTMLTAATIGNGNSPPQEVSPPLPQNLAKAAEAAARYQRLKEDAKHQAMHQLAILRKMVLALDKKLDFDGACFFLTFAELGDITAENRAKISKLALARRVTYRAHLQAPPLPMTLTYGQLEAATYAGTQTPHIEPGELTGKRISGNHAPCARACVAGTKEAEIGADLPQFRDGDILVCPLVHPAWLRYVMRGSGVVSEVGGWLSHMAIVARENNIPMIVGTKGQAKIAHGDIITLGLDGRIDIADPAVFAASTRAAE